MESSTIERKLTTILHADVAGYSRLMGADEVGTLHTLTAYRHITDPLIQQHRGRVVGSAGDSILAEFASVVEAVQCAVEIQHTLAVKNNEFPSDRRMEFRIGINLGDVIVEGEQIYGDGVNIAARLESLAEPGGICLAGTVYEQIKNKLALHYEDLGEQRMKNIAEPVRVYRVKRDGETGPTVGAARRGRPSSQPRRVRPALQIGAGLVLLTAIVIAVRYWSSPIPNPQSPTPNTQLPLSTQDSALRTDAAPAALPLPDKPSIVVLPFVNMSEDPKQEYFSDGLTEDLTSDLSKISSLFVIARNSAFTYKGKAVKVQYVSKELGVRYVLEGSVRKADGQVRITAQLVDATTGGHLWSERYDRPLTDIFALQDEIRQKIVFALKVKLTPEEHERFQRAPTNNLEAYDYYLRGLESSQRAIRETKKEANAQARQMLERALELDQIYAGAYAGLGWTYWIEWFQQWNLDRAQSLDRALELAQRAVALDNSLSMSHRVLANVYVFKKQYDQAIVEAEQAIALAPNDANGYVTLGWILAYVGRPEEAIGLTEKAIRLNPRYPVYLNNLGWAYRVSGRYEEALAPLKKVLILTPNFATAHLNLAGCYAELGRQEEARTEVAEALRLNPTFSLEKARQMYPFKDPTDLERFLASWSKAGLK
ncbi:MAG: adenylate/guanylate cyclase domain-containing protein [Deltaproteobacteria bacterium]|nr:adenylate/guanylate cyclase domain-containing protein [Deltaproteobacteria bacterium]